MFYGLVVVNLAASLGYCGKDGGQPACSAGPLGVDEFSLGRAPSQDGTWANFEEEAGKFSRGFRWVSIRGNNRRKLTRRKEIAGGLQRLEKGLRGVLAVVGAFQK